MEGELRPIPGKQAMEEGFQCRSEAKKRGPEAEWGTI